MIACSPLVQPTEHANGEWEVGSVERGFAVPCAEEEAKGKKALLLPATVQNTETTSPAATNGPQGAPQIEEGFAYGRGPEIHHQCDKSQSGKLRS